MSNVIPIIAECVSVRSEFRSLWGINDVNVTCIKDHIIILFSLSLCVYLIECNSCPAIDSCNLFYPTQKCLSTETYVLILAVYLYSF